MGSSDGAAGSVECRNGFGTGGKMAERVSREGTKESLLLVDRGFQQVV